MKNLLYLILFIAFTAISCKKDYPDDIPQWLKNKIDLCSKKGNCCEGNIPMRIDEYKHPQTGKIDYLFQIYESPSFYDIYDYDGNLLCSAFTAPPGNYSCGGDTFPQFDHIRRVWTQEEKTCK
jgi:hypothetical protein